MEITGKNKVKQHKHTHKKKNKTEKWHTILRLDWKTTVKNKEKRITTYR